MKICVIPDIGGHATAFNTMLKQAGVKNCQIPKNTTIIQLGDLVHKGPDSVECVNIAEKLINTNPDRYIQLVGNHEAHYLGGVQLYGRAGVVKIPDSTIKILKYWWKSNIMKVAFAATTEYGNMLFTHAGITKTFWNEINSPITAEETAHVLNNLKSNKQDLIFREGKLTLGGNARFNVGPLNARTGAELASEWLTNGSMPFSQTHGHETLYWWTDKTWHYDVPTYVKEKATVDLRNKRTHLKIGDKHIFSVDPAFNVEKPKEIPTPIIFNIK